MTLREWAEQRLDSIEKFPKGWGSPEGIMTAYWDHLEMALFDGSDMKEVCDRVRDALVKAKGKHFGPGPVVIWQRVQDDNEGISKLMAALKDMRKELLGE